MSFKTLFIQNLHPATSYHLGVISNPYTATTQQLCEWALPVPGGVWVALGTPQCGWVGAGPGVGLVALGPPMCPYRGIVYIPYPFGIWWAGLFGYVGCPKGHTPSSRRLAAPQF